jgi:hypothetical protein
MTRWTFDEAGWKADIEAIKAEQRAKRQQLAFNRAAFWERMMDTLDDYDDPLGDRPASQR